MGRVFVIYRGETDAGVRNIVHGYEVHPEIGQYGGILLEERRIDPHTDRPDPRGGPGAKSRGAGRDPLAGRKVLRREVQWTPEQCVHENCQWPFIIEGEFTEDIKIGRTGGPITRRCPECHAVINWERRDWAICEPTEADAQWLAQAGGRVDWKWSEVHSQAEIEHYRRLINPEQAPAEMAESAAQAAAEQTQENVADANAYRKDLLHKAKEIREAGGPEVDLRQPNEVLERYVDTYAEAIAAET